MSKKQKVFLAVALLGILFGIYRVAMMSKKAPPTPPLYSPAASPFLKSVAASGIIEAVEENVSVQPRVAGLVKKITVNRGQNVRTGETLFYLDDDGQRAVVARLTSEVAASEAALKQTEATLANTAQEYTRKEALYKEELVTRQQYDDITARLSVAKSEKKKAEATVKTRKSALEEALLYLSWHAVRAPRNGTVLQINILPGEWVQPGQSEPPILMGFTGRMQIRADVDEINAVEVRPGAKAVAYLRGYTDKNISLEFVRIDPYVVPKSQLTGDNRERVDVRVLQVIYSFKPPDFPVYPGQQVDVFIESEGRPKVSER
jgi:RND family efflux transporter MFP subunit